jgi:hypothetical protein
MLARTGLPAWERGFEFRPFTLDVYGAMGPCTKQLLQHLTQRHSEDRPMNTATYKGHGL